MENLIQILNFAFVGLIIFIPIFIIAFIRKKCKKHLLLKYLLLCFFVLTIVIFLFGWWSDKSDLILLKYYGYNIDGMNDMEIYGNVLPQNREKVNNLVRSIMGIGWPIKAYFGYLISIPYLLFIYFGRVVFDKINI